MSLRTALRHRGVNFIEGNCNLSFGGTSADSLVNGIQVDDSLETADLYVLADGAWSLRHIPSLPLRPVKGQFLILEPKDDSEPLIQHVIRTPDV